MINNLQDRLCKLEKVDFLEILFHPLLIPFLTSIAWTKSLWASRILLWGQWSRYHGFHAHSAINNLFYRTQWINIERYGRVAKSPIIGLGDFPLSNWWYLSLLSSYFYAYAGAVTTLVGTLFLGFSHLLWLQTGNLLWSCMVVVALLSSSTAYGMAFSRQNYQILSWMFMPVALFGLMNEQLIIASAAFFIASILGITAFVVSLFLLIIYAIHFSQFNVFVVILPAVVVIMLKLFPLFIMGNFRDSLVNIGKLIGLIHVSIRYKRKSMQFSLTNIYFLLLYVVAIGFIWFGKEQLPIFLIGAYFLFLLNQRFVRFADEQSLMIVFVLVAAMETLLAPFEWSTLFGMVIASNPMPLIFGGGGYIKPKNFSPFDVSQLISKVTNFLEVPGNSKILFAFDDPQDEYEKLFDGYRVLIELPLVAAAEKEVHLFPDWYAVFETNYNGAPNVWGRSVEEVEKNLSFWGAEYVIVYQDSGTNLASSWHDSFEIVSELDWNDMLDTNTLKELIYFSKSPPKWWLLRKN